MGDNTLRLHCDCLFYCHFKQIMKKKISIEPIGIAVWLWLFLFKGLLCAFGYVCAIFLHELGHYAVAKRLGYKLSRFCFSPYGFSLSYYNQTLDRDDEFWIALAGPAINVFSALLTLGVWWLFPQTYFLLKEFVVASFVIAFLNLLPCYPLDGGRMFVCLSQRFLNEKKSQKVTIVFSLLTSAIFLFMFILSCVFDFNPTFLLFSIFVFSGTLDLSQKTKYERINIFCKKAKLFKTTCFLCQSRHINLPTFEQNKPIERDDFFCDF